MDASFFQWFSDDEAQLSAELGAIIKDDLWPSPLQYYMSSEDDVDEEGEDNNSDEEDGAEYVEKGDEEDDEN